MGEERRNSGRLGYGGKEIPLQVLVGSHWLAIASTGHSFLKKIWDGATVFIDFITVHSEREVKAGVLKFSFF